MKRLLVLQSGGATAAANAILAGAIAGARRLGVSVLGAIEGLHGLAEGRVVALDGLTEADLAKLAERPGCALVSHRGELDEETRRAVAETLRSQAAALLVIGGGGSLRAAASIGASADVPVAGVLNTIDNDVEDFAYSPGFLTAAAALADAVASSRLDVHAMRSCNEVAVVETMGRDCGWLAAAAGSLGHADLIFVPERPRTLEEIALAVAECVQRAGVATVVIAEGAREPDGELLAARAGEIPTDPLGRPVIDMGAGPAAVLADRLRSGHGLRSRLVRPGIAQRGGAPLRAEREQAQALGQAAVQALADGLGGEAFGPGGRRPLHELRERVLRAPCLDERGVDAQEVRAELARWLDPRAFWEPAPWSPMLPYDGPNVRNEG